MDRVLTLVVSLTVLSGCRAGAAGPGEPSASAVVAIPTPDARVAAFGLRPLRNLPLPPGEREVRLWIGGGLGWPYDLYRMTDSAGVVTGELIRYWPATAELPDGTTSDDVMVADLRGRCEDFVVADGLGFCRATFTRPPDWAALLERAEQRGLWTLPDPDALPLPPAEPENPDRVRPIGPRPTPVRIQLDGWGMTVELRDGRDYRTYRYRFPLDSDTPEGATAGAIATDVRTTAGELLRRRRHR